MRTEMQVAWELTSTFLRNNNLTDQDRADLLRAQVQRCDGIDPQEGKYLLVAASEFMNTDEDSMTHPYRLDQGLSMIADGLDPIGQTAIVFAHITALNLPKEQKEELEYVINRPQWFA